ncbi:MAG: hypothetical protein ACT4N2_15475 [Hyphomicrobium sp.]
MPLPDPLSTSGTMRPWPFLLTALLTYLAGFAALLLLSTPVMERAGVWPYVVVQAVLNWVWYALHRRRLRDSGLGAGWSGPVLALNVVLQLALVAAVYGMTALQVNAAAEQAAGVQGPASTWIGLGLIYLIFGMLFGSSPLAEVWHIGAILSAGVVAILAVTLAYTAQLAMRPRVPRV